jgi:ceramide glucosyltransferase
MTAGSVTLFGIAILGLLLQAVGVACIYRLGRRRFPRGAERLGISILKPLCGIDDGLEENLSSHLAVDYDGPWELVLGLHSERDPAFPVAKAFAQAHPDRVRLVLQRGEPGYNPKVNQLLTLTEEARYPVVAVTDSNIRVPRSFLREVGDVLQLPKVAIATHLFCGVGEKKLGAILDNLTLAAFAGPSLAGSTLFRLEEVVGKSMAMKKADLERIGGWASVKDKLAEDQQLGLAFRALGLRSVFFN